ncbi:MAG: 3-phosphoglycerate kinase [Thiopseudomonas sp.]|nr:3-phosphoglycerate kinase [Thiopseudomonas sp.]MCK9465792.1 3-phosphoglycerate kinase [Thiopseudomonas sp.]
MRYLSKTAVFFAVVFSSAAMAFPFEVKEQLNGLPIAIETMDLGDNLAAVSLYNYGEQDAQCSVRFQGGPQTPRLRKARVAAQQKVNLTASFNNQIIRMRVQVTCRAVKQGK